MCDDPIYVDNPKRGCLPFKIPLPCGRCAPCKMRKIRQWSFRLKKQDELALCSYFVTLTYDTSTVPISNAGRMTLSKRDVQLFLKRFRKLSGLDNIKYYLCGEYGTKNWRPHYHAIIYMPSYVDQITFDKQLTKAWGLGSTHIGNVTGDSIAYTLKYMEKPKRVPAYKTDDRIKEFSLKSKGLGSNYLTSNTIKHHTENLDKNYVVSDGYKIPMPKYYRDKLLTDDQKAIQRDIINSSVAASEATKQEEFYLLYPDGDYSLYQASEKQTRSNHFFNQQKERKL